MIRQCAWCLTILGEAPPLKDTSTTHGMCKACLKKIEQEVEMMARKELKRAV